MKSSNRLLQILKYILSENIPPEDKATNIKDFQDLVWNDDESNDNLEFDEIISELAYDLDFYEPNEKMRLESQSYYGEEKLKKVVKNGIQKIEEYFERQKDQKN